MEAANPKSKIQNPKLNDFFRAVVIVAVACAIGLATNALKENSIAILDPNGPGAIPDEPRISIENFKELLAGKSQPLILDARSPGDYRLGHPPGAINVAEADFISFYNERSLSAIVQASQNVIVLCNDAQCPAADRVARILRQMGHTNIRVLRDGWRGYEKSGLPVEKGSVTP